LKRVLLAAASGIGLGAALVLRSSLRVPIFDAGSADEVPSLLCSLPDPLLLLLAGGAGGLLGGLLGFRGKAHLATPFLPAGLAAAVLVPGAFSAAPFLAAFSGRFLDLVLLSCLLVALGRYLSRATLRPAPVVLVSAGAFVVYAVLGLWIAKEVGLSGDEPHYLLVTYSLLHDRDLEVQDNYAQEDYRHFYGGTIGAHLGEGTRYSVHGVGVSLLLLPGFALGGLAGVAVTEALVAALLLGAIYSLAFELTGSGKAASFGATAFGLTSPALFLSVSAYPELPAALVVTLAARRLVREDVPSARTALLWSLLLGVLPFFHVKFVPLAALLFAALVLRFGLRLRPSLYGLVAGAALSLLAFLLFSFWTAGSFDPTASYGRQRVFLDRIPLGTAGLLFDQEFGLLPSSPVYLLGLAALASLLRRKRILGVVALLAFLAVLIPSAAHPLWTGGSSPPARFLFPGLPLLMVAAACLVAREPEAGIGSWAPSLLAVSLALSFAMLFLSGAPLYLNARDGRGQVWEALSSSWDLADYLPSLVEADSRSLFVAVGLGFVVLAAIAAQAALRRLRLPAFAVVLLLGAWAQDLTGVSRSRDLEAPWTLEAMRGLGGRETFAALPSFQPLSRERVADALALPLLPDPRESDPTSWWSGPYLIPAGRFEVSGIESAAIELYNGEGCFSKGEASFSSNVALGRFRVRAFSLAGAPRLRMREPLPALAEAQRTVALAPGSRLHGLDDEVYLDPGGFWVRKSSRASFALEIAAPDRTPPPLSLRNGGVENRVEIAGPRNTTDFPLRPWEVREVLVEGEGPVVLFTLESAGGFRPSDLDPGSRDRRELGVLIRAQPAFD
jgi:hypothetical protein